MRIDVWSDIACPWCYVGKRRLSAAFAATGAEADVTWHAFELSPELPAAGLPIEEHYGKRFGMERLRRMDAQMTELGAQDGITFRFDLRTRAANTFLAHRAIRIAREMGGASLQDAVVEACFRANFSDGVDVSDRDALLGALAKTAIDVDALRTRLAGDDAREDVLDDEKTARKMGINGVPFFVAGGKLAMSGAQPVEAFAGFLAKARELGE
jgi:predicted DsbA family dithiol-disulfide isomerase